MKYVISMCLIALCTATAISQRSIDNIFDRYADNEEVSKINFSGNFLTNIIQADGDHEDSSIDNFRLLVFENDQTISSLERKAVITELKSDRYEELMQIRDKDSKIDFYIKDSDDYITNLVMFIQSDDNQVLLDIDGNISYDFFNDVSIDFEGSDKLKYVNKKNR